MSQAKPSSRDRILAAAEEVAREAGAGNMSLDAVAARAGVSKGGLLYNFPTKAALMRALVESFIAKFEIDFEAAAESAQGNAALVAAYVELSCQECEETKPGASGVLAALAEDPDFLKPIAAFKRRLLDRLKVGSGDPGQLLVLYLALEGFRSMKLFEMDILSQEERDLAIKTIMDQVQRS